MEAIEFWPFTNKREDGSTNYGFVATVRCTCGCGAICMVDALQNLNAEQVYEFVDLLAYPINGVRHSIEA